MVKYKEYFEKMVGENKDTFDVFTSVHLDYSIDQNSNQKRFNEVGSKILDIIHEYENRLCANTERGMYNKFSGGLAEKFQSEIKSHYPLIDHIGLIVQDTATNPRFNIKKIDLK